MTPELLPLPPLDRLEPLLDPPGEGEFGLWRAWIETTLARALPPGSEPLLLALGPARLLLLRRGGRLSSLTTPYSLHWRPLAPPGLDAAGWRAAGRALAAWLRARPPLALEAMDPAAPFLAPLLSGLAAGGVAGLRHEHFGSWRESWPGGAGWEGYLAARPPALRNTVARKLARAERETRFERLEGPGPALEAGIAAYEAVRAASWKPGEPSPGFDPALMRAAAPLGALRLGVLRDAAGAPLAAQYWLLDRGGRRATVLKLCHAEAARAASPGTVLTALMVRGLLAEGVEALDFGRGDDPYKRLWVGERGVRVGAVLAGPLHPAGLSALARHAAGRLRARWRGGA